MKILSGIKSRKKPIAIIVILLEFLICLVLLYTLNRGAGVTLDKGGFRFVPKEQNEEIQRLEGVVNSLMENYDTLTKTTVSLEEHSKVVNENNRLSVRIRTMRDTAVAAGKLSSAEPLNTPEQVCMAIEQVLRKPAEVVYKTDTTEVDMLIAAVGNEISQRGVIDTSQPEKYGVDIYLIQKVLDAIGYAVNEAGGIKNTSDAVLKFQGDQQLKQDGKVGMGTWGKVREFWSAKKTPGSLPLVQQTPVPTTVRQSQPAVQSLQRQPRPAVQIQPRQSPSNIPGAVQRRQP